MSSGEGFKWAGGLGEDLGPPDVEGLRRHGERLARDLAWLGLPARHWPSVRITADGVPILSTVIVGGGMNGLGVAAALRFKGVHDVVVLERETPGREGPWLTYARMRFLRSIKDLPGLALGQPTLTFRAWFEAAHGAAAWQSLYKIPNGMWVDYLTWFREALGLDVRHGIAVERVLPKGDLVELRATRDGVPVSFLARHVVLATGRAGAGGFHVPDFVDRGLWPDLAAHSYEPIDFARLRGKRIAVIGGASAAWDNAATALEEGAAEIDMFIRRATIPQVNKGRGVASMGAAFHHGWPALSDAERWALFVYLNLRQAPPPHETVHRGLAQPGLRVHLGRAVIGARRDAGRVLLRVAGEADELAYDFLISATGYAVGVSGIAELGELAASTARWRDAYAPDDPALIQPALAEFPYLGQGFELKEREPGAVPGLSRIRLVNHAASASHGDVASDIPGVGIAAERASLSIVQALFREDFPDLRARLEHFAEPELAGTPYFAPEALDG